jgi:hypothetical protein
MLSIVYYLTKPYRRDEIEELNGLRKQAVVQHTDILNQLQTSKEYLQIKKVRAMSLI